MVSAGLRHEGEFEDGDGGIHEDEKRGVNGFRSVIEGAVAGSEGEGEREGGINGSNVRLLLCAFDPRKESHDA